MKIGLVILLFVVALALLFATVGLVVGAHAKHGSKAEKISDFLMDVAIGMIIACILGVVVAWIIILANTL